MEETKVRNDSKTVTFAFNSSPTVEQIELATTQDVTAKPSIKKNKEKSWLSSSQDDTTTCCCCNISSKVAKYLELSGLITGVVIVLLLLSIPIISHFALKVKGREINMNNANTSDITCYSYGLQYCSEKNLTWRFVPAISNISKFHAKVYSGNVCFSFFSSWLTCALGGSTSVFVNNSGIILEEIITKLASLLVTYSACNEANVPFLCQFVFPLCDCKTGNLYSPQETCEEVSTVICRILWPLLEQLIQPLKLPHCSVLPMTTNVPDISGSGNSDISPTTVNSCLSQETVCADQFVKINGTCYARCDSFEQSPHDVTIAVKNIQLFAACYGFTIGTIFLILSFVRWKTMLFFPSIFLVYMTADYCIIGFFIIVSQIDRSKLYCNSVAITKEDFNDSTIFCQVTGAVFHYFIVNIALWWFFHVCSIFYKIMFPLTAKQYEKKEKYFHIVLLVTGIFIPLPGVLLALSVPDWGYVVNEFPPFLCSTQNSNLWYYSATLPLNILIAIGVSLFVFMFWKLHKHQGIFPTRKNSSFGISTAERKILIALCYYVVFTVVMLLYFGLITADTDSFIEALETYFRCQALGHLPNQTSQCDPKEYQQYIYPELAAITYFLMAFITTANLTFVIKWSAVAKFCSQFYPKKEKSSNVMLPNPLLSGESNVNDSHLQ